MLVVVDVFLIEKKDEVFFLFSKHYDTTLIPRSVKYELKFLISYLLSINLFLESYFTL